ncbi:MAG: hypothetical protein ACHQNT_13535 [Bacteroidia bacterium]
MKKKLLLTFDYELFLGNRSGSVDDCLINPTLQTLSVLKKFNAKSIFFVDTVYLLRLKKLCSQYPVCKNDFDKITSQLQQIVTTGHYVFPHLHPHWLDAEYLENTNEWRLNSVSKYRFHNTSDEEKKYVFDESVQVLKDIISPVTPGYQIDCYRAGGWCIQPFEDFKPFFLKHGFKYDMSVLAGFYLFSSAQYFDFSSAPEKNIYSFEDDIMIEKTGGSFTEFNISYIFINDGLSFLNKLLLKYLFRLKGDHSHTRGQGQIAVKTDMQKPVSNGFNILTSKNERIAVELLTAVKFRAYLDYINKHDYMHFISHPKMLLQHNHKMFEKFLSEVFRKYEVETDFKKMI